MVSETIGDLMSFWDYLMSYDVIINVCVYLCLVLYLFFLGGWGGGLRESRMCGYLRLIRVFFQVVEVPGSGFGTFGGVGLGARRGFHRAKQTG